MQGMSASSPPILTSAITDSPRFGVVPVVSTANGRNSEAIDGFLGIYLDMAFGKNNKVDAIDAWVIPSTSLNRLVPAMLRDWNFTAEGHLWPTSAAFRLGTVERQCQPPSQTEAWISGSRHFARCSGPGNAQCFDGAGVAFFRANQWKNLRSTVSFGARSGA